VHGTQRYTGPSTNVDCVRGCLALTIQAASWLIADIAQAYGPAWDTAYLRLTVEWFQRNLPPTRPRHHPNSAPRWRPSPATSTTTPTRPASPAPPENLT
jgi:hypothetical protein